MPVLAVHVAVVLSGLAEREGKLIFLSRGVLIGKFPYKKDLLKCRYVITESQFYNGNNWQ